MNFLLRLEQIEKRFPGLYNVRVGMVDVLPVALMDSTRFSLDLTHTGSGQLRIKGQPDVPLGMPSESVFNVSDLPLADYDWTKTPKELWPVKILVNEPETAVFSGLSRQDAASAFPVASSGQRNAFEGRGLAGGWQIDMSARENQVVPGQPRRSADYLHRVGLPRFRSARGHRRREASYDRADQFSVRAADLPGRLL